MPRPGSRDGDLDTASVREARFGTHAECYRDGAGGRGLRDRVVDEIVDGTFHLEAVETADRYGIERPGEQDAAPSGDRLEVVQQRREDHREIVRLELRVVMVPLSASAMSLVYSCTAST